MIIRIFGLATLVAASLVSVGLTRADDEKVPLEKLPKGILEAVKKRFPKAEIKSAEMENQDGKTTFEVNIKDEGKNINVTLNPGGTILTIEKEIALKDVPKVVSDAVKAKYPKSVAKSAEEVIVVKDGKETLSYYEFLVPVDGKDIEVEVLPDGKLKPAEKAEKK